MSGGDEPNRVGQAFERESVVLALTQLSPLKIMRPGTKESNKYKQILTSVRAVGLVEPHDDGMDLSLAPRVGAPLEGPVGEGHDEAVLVEDGGPELRHLLAFDRPRGHARQAPMNGGLQPPREPKRQASLSRVKGLTVRRGPP